MALGAGGAVAVQVAAGLGLVAYAVATDGDDRETTTNPPAARELDSPPPWPVGTCLREQRPALSTCVSLHPSAEVSRRDGRVTCLLAAPRRTPPVGSLTAADLRPPQPPLPFE